MVIPSALATLNFLYECTKLNTSLQFVGVMP